MGDTRERLKLGRSRRPVEFIGLIAGFIVGVPLLFVLATWIHGLTAPPALTYPILPLPAENPQSNGAELPSNELLVVHAGEQVPFLPTRCVTDDAGTGTGRLLVAFSRNLVNAQTGVETNQIGGVIDIPVGCHQSRSLINDVPQGTPPGIYYFRGIVDARGSAKASSVAWYTVPFRVEP